MVELTAPRTPTPSSRSLRRQDHDSATHTGVALTPPPSDSKARANFASRHVRQPVSPSKSSFAPIMAKTHSRTGSFGSAMPSPEQIRSMPEEQLRELASDLIPSLGEARMELAHVKLQYQLLSIETRESAERAEVEHDMTRKEVEVLQAGSPILQSRAIVSPDPRSALAQVQRQLEDATMHNSALETDNAALDRRLRDAKRVIKILDGKNLELSDSNKMLRERIRENREHLNAMRLSGMLKSTPSSPKQCGTQAPAGVHSINHYATPSRPRRPEVHHIPATPIAQMTSTIAPSTTRPQDDPFGALLFAGEVLNAQQQRASVPSTPSPARTIRQPPSHTRGTHSLSSLPVTPRTSRLQQVETQSPSHKISQELDGRRHSASTISDSDAESTLRQLYHATRSDADDEKPLSQASQAASDLLRRYPGPVSQERPTSGPGLIQTKLTGKIVKSNKRSYSERKGESPKKQKTNAPREVGLGIGMWPSPAR